MTIETMPLDMLEASFEKGTQIKVIGVGGGGGNAVQHMIDSGVQGVEFICANTDAQALGKSSAHQLIQLGSNGLGAGSKPEKGRAAALASESDIRSALEGANMLFITAGMGGGTGTGAAPVIARIARDMGVLTLGVVTRPFDWEGGRRMSNADAGLAELEANVDSLIVVMNEKLHEVLGDDVSQDEAFAFANDVLKNSVGGIAEIINVEALVNVDFEDVRTVMSEPGKAMMGTATASGPDRARIAAEQAVACPLLEGVDMHGAKGVLVLITAKKGGLKLSESKLAMNTIRDYASEQAHVIYGTAYDESLGDEIRVTVVATGLSAKTSSRPGPQLQVLRTGTDNLAGGYGLMPSMSTGLGGYGSTPSTSPANPAYASSPVSTPAGLVNSSFHGLNAASGADSVNTTPNNAPADYSNMAVPSVWRNNRTQAAAKVDALSSGGMEDIEIPAFLRKQAD
jgi:cell division protein FtsZ